MIRQPEISTRIPPESLRPSRPLDVFHQELDRVKTGRIKRIDLVTIQQDVAGKTSTMSPVVKQLAGDNPILFSDRAIHEDLKIFFQELSAENEPFQVLWAMRNEGDGIRDSSHSHHDILTMKLDAVGMENVQFGVSVVTDQSRDWSWTYFIAQPPKPKFRFFLHPLK